MSKIDDILAGIAGDTFDHAEDGEGDRDEVEVNKTTTSVDISAKDVNKKDETVESILEKMYSEAYKCGVGAKHPDAYRSINVVINDTSAKIAAHYAAKEQEAYIAGVNADKRSVQEAVLRARMEGHELGFRAGISAFSGYYMDASLPAQRHPILPDIARELLDNYHVYSYFANIPDLTNQLNQLKGEK